MAIFDFSKEIDALNAFIDEHDEPVTLKPAADQDLEWLSEQQYPEDIQAFFAAAEPDDELESEGVFLVPVRQLRTLSAQAVPGIYVTPLGFLLVANTVGGDVYCVDTGQLDEAGDAPIRIIPHDSFSSAPDALSVRAVSPVLAASFSQFLLRFVAEDLPYDHSHASWFK